MILAFYPFIKLVQTVASNKPMKGYKERYKILALRLLIGLVLA